MPGIGRIKTGRYKRWRKAAGWEVRAQLPQPISGPVYAFFEFGEALSKSDGDNLVKALLDLLVWLQLIDGDDKATVRGFMVRWVPGELLRIAVLSA